MTSKQPQRPQTLADVAEIARQNSSELPWRSMSLSTSSIWITPTRWLNNVAWINPPSVANHLIDAWIGAAGEHLAQRWGLGPNGIFISACRNRFFCRLKLRFGDRYRRKCAGIQVTTDIHPR
jgi:hypothetical protein